jgi:hypothetical protein
MSTLLDAEDRELCWLLPASSVGGEVDVACTGTAGEASEWELCPFPGRLQIAVGRGTLDGQVRETIGRWGGPIAVRARLGRFGLSSPLAALDASEWLSRSPLALDFLESPLSG